MSITLLAHGSPDSRHSRDVGQLTARLRLAGIPAQPAYLDHHDPTPEGTARALLASGVRTTTVVPLLLTPAHHARVDVPIAVRAMRAAAPGLGVSQADPVGLHRLVFDGARELVEASGLPIGDRTGIVLTATGSRNLRAVGAIETLVREHGPILASSLGARRVRAAYLDGGRPIGRIATLMRCADGCSSIVVVTLMIADGILRDRMVAAAQRHDLAVAPGTLADTHALADLVIVRAGSAPASPASAPLAGSPRI